VRWRSEYRCFLKEGKLLTASLYRTDGELDVDEVPPEALPPITALAEEAAKTHKGRGVVVDVGRLEDGAYAVIEANECYASGLYACNPDRALEVVRAEQSFARRPAPPLDM